MKAIIDFLGVGGVTASALIVLSVCIEITPIKFSPLKWLGERIFSSTNKRLDKLEEKFDNHIVQDYRKTILNFQNECLRGEKHTLEEFKFILKSCDAYEEYIEANNIRNGEVSIAMEYLRKVYQTALEKHDFVEIK